MPVENVEKSHIEYEADVGPIFWQKKDELPARISIFPLSMSGWIQFDLQSDLLCQEAGRITLRSK